MAIPIDPSKAQHSPTPAKTTAPPPPPRAPAPTTPSSPSSPTARSDQFSTNAPPPRIGEADLLPTSPSGSTLVSEDVADGSANCLDRVGDWLNLAPPQVRARSEVLILRDTRPGPEGQTGHAVIRQGDAVFDPSTGQSYPSFAAFNAAGNYEIAGTVPGSAMQKILSTPPDSPERMAAIERAHVPSTVATMLVADSGGPTKRDVTGAFADLAHGYTLTQSMAGAVEWALQNAAGDPARQAAIVDLLQGMPASQLEQQIAAESGEEIQVPVPGQVNSTPQVQVGGRVPGNALDALIDNVPANLMGPALAEARRSGVLTDETIVQGLGSAAVGGAWMEALTAGGINPISGNSVPEAIAEVQEAQQAYQTALDQRAALDQRLAADLRLFGPYLTPQQQQQYIANFRQEHADEYGSIDEAAQRLDEALSNNAAQVDLALKGPDGAQYADTIYGAYQSLANSPYADHAITWALGASQPGSAFAPFAAQHDLGAVLQDAMPHSITAYITQNPNATPEDAIQHMDDITTAYLAQQGISSTSSLALSWQQGIRGLVTLAGGNADEAMTLIRDVANPALGKGFAAAGLVIGIIQTANSVEQGDALAAAWGATFVAQQGASYVDSALKALGSSSTVAAKAVGGLTVVANILDIGLQVREIQQGQGNFGTGLSIAGDVIGIVGGAMLVASPTGPGAIVVGVGAAVYVVGEVISSMIEQNEQQQELLQEQRDLLASVGADPGAIMDAAYNVVSPNAQLPIPNPPGTVALLQGHDPSGIPIVFDLADGQTLVFTGMGPGDQIQYRDPFTGETGSMTADEFRSMATGIHISSAEYEAVLQAFRPPTPSASTTVEPTATPTFTTDPTSTAEPTLTANPTPTADPTPTASETPQPTVTPHP